MKNLFNLSRHKKEAAANPKVGIWWLINNNLVTFTKEIPRGVYNVDSDSPNDHMTEWWQVQKAYPGMRGKDYDNVPRGRVTLRSGRFAILLGADMNNSGVVNKVMREFSLPRNLVDVIVDEHYETQAVDPELGAIMSYSPRMLDDDEF